MHQPGCTPDAYGLDSESGDAGDGPERTDPDKIATVLAVMRSLDMTRPGGWWLQIGHRRMSVLKNSPPDEAVKSQLDLFDHSTCGFCHPFG
ncbi:hypothetical protein ADK67_42035 [Saccharothrix sp. NRRL B-16348]|nr:hypothetical protein ADK67_42035 [Saccharothrix sp. NRRL B-16348]